jgi:D-sedoheptulose 7-phosphate isomerase
MAIDKINYIFDYLSEVKDIASKIDREDIIRFIYDIEILRNKKGRLFILGVGGSAANASHAVNDFRKILNIESYTVTDNAAELTARINDESWEDSYKNWLKGSRLNERDAILVFSVGGGSNTTSKNLVKAMDYAKECKSNIISVVSRDGGYAKEVSDTCIIIPVVDTNRITCHAEEWQGIIFHLVVNYFTK